MYSVANILLGDIPKVSGKDHHPSIWDRWQCNGRMLYFGAKFPGFKSCPGGPASDAIMIGCAVCSGKNVVIILGLSVPAGTHMFTATFSATDVAGFLLP